MKMSDVSCEVSFADYVSECVKNHDRLEQENAELRDDQRELLKAVKFLFSKASDLNELQSKKHI